MSDQEGIIVNAAERFSMRRTEADVQRDADHAVTGVDGADLIGDTIRHHTVQFTDYLLHTSPQAADLLASDLSVGFDVTLGGSLLRRSNDCAIDDESLVVHTRDRSQPKPRLLVSLALVNHLNRVIDPAFNTMNGLRTPEEQAEAREIATKQIKVATAMASWLGLGKWAFDSLDPRADERWQTDKKFLTALAQDIGLDTAKMKIPSPDLVQAIDKNMIIARFRLVGAMMYRGAISELSDTSRSFLDNLVYLKGMRSQLFQMQAESDPAKITGLEFALAQPLSDAAVARLLNVLAT